MPGLLKSNNSGLIKLENVVQAKEPPKDVLQADSYLQLNNLVPFVDEGWHKLSVAKGRDYAIPSIFLFNIHERLARSWWLPCSAIAGSLWTTTPTLRLWQHDAALFSPAHVSRYGHATSRRLGVDYAHDAAFHARLLSTDRRRLRWQRWLWGFRQRRPSVGWRLQL